MAPFQRILRPLIPLTLTACGLALPAWADDPIARIEGDLPPKLRDTIELNLERVEEKSRSRAQAKRRLERAATSVQSVLFSQGYYDPDIQGRIDEAPPKDDPGITPPLRAVLNVVTGPQYKLGELPVVFSDAIEEQDLASAELKLTGGDPAIASDVVAAGLRITNWLEQHGYPEAELLGRETTLDHGTDTLSVTYNVSPGPKVRMGELRLSGGDAKLTRGWVEMIKSYEDEELYDTRKLDKINERVIATGVFEQAISTLDETDAPNPDGTITRNVLLNITQGDKNTISGSVGFSTTEGSGVEVIYERRNFIGYAQTLTLRGVARTNQIGVGANYRIPYFFRVDRDFVGDLELIREDTDAFEGERALARFLIGQQINDRFRIGVGAGVEASRFIQNDIERDAYVVDAIGTAVYDARNNRLDATKGFILSAEAVPSYGFGDEQAFFTRVELDGAAYQRVSPEFVLAGRLGVGSLFGSNLNDIPFNRRFYAGGGGSVRGFGFQSLGPRDDQDEATGGRSVVEGSAELRWRSRTLFDGNLGGAIFVDAASVAEPQIADFRDIRYGAGVGVRYYTGFAPLRADIAIPLNPRDGDDAFQIYISIGQAF